MNGGGTAVLLVIALLYWIAAHVIIVHFVVKWW